VNDLMGGLPQPIMERMGRMSGMALRSVIALIDEEPGTFAALVERIGTWDDEPGRVPYPLPRYEFPIQEALRIVGEAVTAIEQKAGSLPNEDMTEGARRLVEQFAPEEYREDALAKLAAIPPGTGPVEISGGEDGGPVDFVVATAMAAWLGRGAGGRTATTASIRLMLLEQVRRAESMAIGAPERERVDKVSDAEALALMDGLFGGGYARLIPGPNQRGPWEWDMIAVLKAHLMETPADATTPEQAEQLKARLLSLLEAAVATQKRKAEPSVRTVGKRTQPKRKPKRKR